MKIEIGKRYMFDILGSQYIANDTYSVTVVKKKSLFSNKYICISDQTHQTLIVPKKLLSPIVPNNKNLPVFIQRKANSLSFDEIDYNILDDIYSEYLETLRECIPKDGEKINRLMDELIDVIKMNLGIILSKMSLQVYNNKEAINIELAENRLIRNCISPDTINRNKNFFLKDLEIEVDRFIMSTKNDILEADSYDEVNEIFLEKFPYKCIVSTVQVNDNSIEKLIGMITDALSRSNIDFIVIPTVTPGTNLSDITEEQLNSIKNFNSSTDINEIDESLEELLSFRFGTMIFDKEQSYDEMYDIISEVFEVCTIENDDKKITTLPFDIIVLSYEYSKE
ncbi:MAG: hypothetical protein ACI4V7_09550 [Succinivibrionaceae bacterium]